MSTKIHIDPVAARADINRITNAIPDLQAARAALLRVKEEGEATQGKTGNAIVNKSQALISRIDKLISSLNSTKREIQETVRLNQQAEEEMARAFANMLQ